MIMHEKIQRYSLRKLSVGLASVMVGACIFSVNGKTVKADVTSDQTTQLAKVQGQTTTTQPQSNDVQNEKQQTQSAQNSVADQSQKNLMDDLCKQKTSTQSGDQAEAQENRLVDQINHKLTNQNGTNHKEVLGQNLTAPDGTKSDSTTKSDVEKSIVGSSLAQKINNQSNDHAEDNSQTQPQNSKKLAKKVLATNLIETTSSPMKNGGFDEATWGKLDVTKWQGSVQDGVYQLTYYFGDRSHIIVPNEADFEKAGKSTNGLQVGIDRDTVSLLPRLQGQTIAFSKTNNQKVKAIGTDWSSAFFNKTLSKFDGSNLDTSNISNMSNMFNANKISDLTSLAKWNTSNVTNMSGMFEDNKISDLTPLTHWDISKVTNMSYMFEDNKISDLTPLTHWDTSKVTDMSGMFLDNQISNLNPLAHWDTSKVTNMSGMFLDNQISNLNPLAHWDTSKVTDMSEMFENNPDIIDLKPIANWNISNVNTDDGFFSANTKLNLTNVNNTPLMQGFLKDPDALLGATFVTNNTDLVKATTGKDLPNLTNTAKRTITFKLPHVAPKTIVQTINYKAVAPVQIDWFDPDSSKIVQTYPVKDSDWQLDTSKKNDDVIIDGVICFKPVKMPHINGYKAHLIKDPVNPTALLVSFMAVPEQPQNNQSNNIQSSQKEAQPEQKQPEPIQNTPAPVESDKEVAQILNHIAFELMHNSSDNADSFEPAQDTSDSFEAPSDSTQKDDAAKPQKVNAAKHKKHIVKKHVIKKHKKHAKKYHLKRRLRKHSKRSKKRIIKHRKSVSRKFRKHNLKHVKKN